MNLFIQVKNGCTVNHPAFESNLIEAFGAVPPNWEPFVRVERPAIPLYKILDLDAPKYKKINDVWTDAWVLRPMTELEKAAKQQEVINKFNNREQSENWSAWTLDEATCTMVPPIPRPEPDQAKLDQGIFTFWCGADGNWKDAPSRPTDGGQYKFDFLVWKWVVVA